MGKAKTRPEFPIKGVAIGQKVGQKTRALQLAMQQQILKLYAKGQTIEQIANALQMKIPYVTNYLDQAVEAHTKMFSLASPAHTFVRYSFFQMGVIQKLQHLYDVFVEDEENKQYGAAVNALKAQSDIADKIFDKGHFYGIIQERKADKAIHMTPKAVKQELRKEVEALTSLLNQIDSHDLFLEKRRLYHLRLMASMTKKQKKQYKNRKLAKVKKVRKDSLGFITLLRTMSNWMYRTRVYDKNRNALKPHRLTQEQRESILEIKVPTVKADRDAVLYDQDVELFEQYEKRKAFKEELERRRRKQKKEEVKLERKEREIREGYDQETNFPLV